MTYTRAALLQRLKKGDVVYHGFAGHFFLEDIPHVLKVLITSLIISHGELISIHPSTLHTSTVQPKRKPQAQAC